MELSFLCVCFILFGNRQETTYVFISEEIQFLKTQSPI